jgi:hypothetical protein
MKLIDNALRLEHSINRSAVEVQVLVGRRAEQVHETHRPQPGLLPVTRGMLPQRLLDDSQKNTQDCRSRFFGPDAESISDAWAAIAPSIRFQNLSCRDCGHIGKSIRNKGAVDRNEKYADLRIYRH